MAWTAGELITASKLNSDNAAIKSSYSNYNWNGNVEITSAWHYIHHTTGKCLYIRAKNTSNWFAAGKAWFYFRNSAGVVSTVSLWNYSYSANKDISATINVNSYGYGPGWYQAKVSVYMGQGWIDVFWGQSNCWRGGKLVYWDGPTSSGNRIIGEKLTSGILNSGRVGVI